MPHLGGTMLVLVHSGTVVLSVQLFEQDVESKLADVGAMRARGTGA